METTLSRKATALQSELQLEKEKNEIKFVVLKSEINHWEQKCLSLSRELDRMARAADCDYVQVYHSSRGSKSAEAPVVSLVVSRLPPHRVSLSQPVAAEGSRQAAQPLLPGHPSTHSSSDASDSRRAARKKKPGFDRDGGPGEGGRHGPAEEGLREAEVADCVCGGLSLFSCSPRPASHHSLHY